MQKGGSKERCVVCDIVVRKIMYVIRKMCARGMGAIKECIFHRSDVPSFARSNLSKERFFNETRNSRGLPDVDVPSPAATRR